jgi:hypothetical protein
VPKAASIVLPAQEKAGPLSVTQRGALGLAGGRCSLAHFANSTAAGRTPAPGDSRSNASMSHAQVKTTAQSASVISVFSIERPGRKMDLRFCSCTGCRHLPGRISGCWNRTWHSQYHLIAPDYPGSVSLTLAGRGNETATRGSMFTSPHLAAPDSRYSSRFSVSTAPQTPIANSHRLPSCEPFAAVAGYRRRECRGIGKKKGREGQSL